MAFKAANPAPLAKAAGLGIVVHGEAIDVRNNTLLTLAQQQSCWLERRFRLTPSHAATVASLAFVGGAR